MTQTSNQKVNKVGMYAVLFIAYAMVNFHRYATSMTASILATDLALDAGQVALYIGVYTWCNAIMQLPAGLITDRISARKLLSVIYFLAGAGLLLMAYTNSFPLILVGRGILTAAVACVFNICSRHIAAWETADDYKRVNSMFMTAGKIGGLVATTPLVVLIAAIGWANTFGFIAAASILVALGAWLFVRDKSDTLQNKSISPLASVKYLAKTRGFWLYCLAGALVGMTVPMVFSAWGGTFLVQGLGVDSVVSSNILMVGNIASCVGGVTVALVCKKIPSKPLVVISYLVITACVALLALFTTQMSVVVYAVIFVIMGFAFYTSTTSVYALMREMCGVKFIGGFMGASNFISWLIGNALVSSLWGLFIPADFNIAGFRNALFFQLAISVVGLIGFIVLKPGMLKGCSDEDVAALEAKGAAN